MVVLSCSMNGVTSWHKIRAGARCLRYNGGGVSYGVIVRDELFVGGNGEGFTYRVIRSGMRCLLR
jgi:hypothetical protein